ncbi:MAG: hypothetical protein ACTSQP_23375 [Promethearchaeota archaeon]
MSVYDKGWYSICTCENLDIETIDSDDLINVLETEKNKIYFLEKYRNEIYTRYQSIRKTRIKIDVYDVKKGLLKKVIPVINRYYFDYYIKKKLIIFHTSINRIRSIVRYLNNTFKSKIYISKNIDLKDFLQKLKSSGINYRLNEGNIINFKLSGGTIGNFHFKNLTQHEYSYVIEQKNTYISWLKLYFEGESENFSVKFYSNGTYYQTRSDDTIFKILDIFISSRKE